MGHVNSLCKSPSETETNVQSNLVSNGSQIVNESRREAAISDIWQNTALEGRFGATGVSGRGQTMTNIYIAAEQTAGHTVLQALETDLEVAGRLRSHEGTKGLIVILAEQTMMGRSSVVASVLNRRGATSNTCVGRRIGSQSARVAILTSQATGSTEVIGGRDAV